MRTLACIVLIQIFFVSISHALDIHLNNPPGDYNIYNWSGSSVKHAGIMSKDVSGFKFSIPDKYVVNKKSGEVDLRATLRKWRKGTPALEGNPRTKNGLGFYPFTDSSGRQRYMALEYLNDRVKNYSGTTLSVHGAATDGGQEIKGDDKTNNPPAQVITAGEDDNSSEVVGGDSQPQVVEEIPAGTGETYDLTQCYYGKICWNGVSFSSRVKKIVSNVEFINSLHNAKLNPRYLLCTGWRESTFNPGALGGVKEKGLFQVRPSTGKAALRYGPKLPGFKDMSSSQYMEKMVNSTLAQTELSFLTLKMKIVEGAPSSVLNGTGSVADYKALAKRYNGGSEKYARAISNCYSCLLTAMPSTTSFTESSVKSCLNKAKH